MSTSYRWGVVLLLLPWTLSFADEPTGVKALQTEQATSEAVAKLIAQLGAAEFRVREQASKELERLGTSVLPALRKAVTSDVELDVKRRLEQIVVRIENAVLHAEEKQWQDLDAPRRGIKDRLMKIFTRTPPLPDEQAVSAIFLLTLGRPPTGDARAQSEKQLRQNNSRVVSVLQLARPLVQSKLFNAEIAAANARILKAQKDLAAEDGLAKQLARLNDDEFLKLMREVATSLNKAAR